MSLSTSFMDPPITPHPKTDTSVDVDVDVDVDSGEARQQQQQQQKGTNENSMMDMSGVSDISSIDEMDVTLTTRYNNTLLLSPTKSPQFIKPPSSPNDGPSLQSRAPHRRPLSPFLEVPTKSPPNWRQYEDASQISQITQRLDSIEIDKENTFSFSSLLKTPRSQPQNQKLKTEEIGSRVRMELITLSPSKSNKYGSQKILSPVRRSTRIEQKYSNKAQTQQQNVHSLLQQSNYTFVPNPMLNKTK